MSRTSAEQTCYLICYLLRTRPIDLYSCAGNNGERDVLMSGDRLAFAEGPTNELGQRSVNVSAYDNIYVEGKTFTARGQRLSYEQAKKLLVLEGTARSDAVLSHQARVGLPRTETVARKIKFWTDTQRVEIQGGSSADISNLGL